MPRYKIHELSARAVIGYTKEQAEDVYTFHLNRQATEKCFVRGAVHEQEDNALFYQIMCVLNGGHFSLPKDQRVITDLADVIFYMDFSGIFDRGSSKKYLDRQRKAEAMFRPEGVTLDFGNGGHRYLAFERSSSMSRQAKLSFLHADIYDEVRRRMMMDMIVGDCQLSKLYAYNGLMLSGGIRIDGVGITDLHRMIVVENPTHTTSASVITVEGGSATTGMKKYRWVERQTDISVTRFDGEGLISKEYTKTIDKKFCGRHIHTSFQVRMPYIKGMLHQVDFKDFLKSAGMETISDIWE